MASIVKIKKFKMKDFKRIRIVVIGTGGTGGFMFPYLMRVLNQNMENDKTCIYEIVLCDADVIESKNTLRQNFYLPEIGKNKAETLAIKHTKMFGKKISVVKEYIETEEKFIEVCYGSKEGLNDNDFMPIIVSCVDNNKTRQLIHSVFKKYPERMIWVDSGNKEWAGQVVVGYNSNKKITENNTTSEMFYLPPVTEVFKDVLEDNTSIFNSEMSCADVSLGNVQNIAANVMSGTVMFTILNQLIAGNKEISTHMCVFSGQNGSSISYYNTFNHLSNASDLSRKM